MKRYWSHCTTQDFDGNLKGYIAVLPLGATEQHGPHLPTGTDSIIGEALVEHVVRKLPKQSKVVFLPSQNIGVSAEHQNFKGTITLDWDVAGKVWSNIGESVARAGITKMIFVTSHGGNTQAMELIARKLRVENGMKTVCTHWQKLGGKECSKSRNATPYTDIHGGEFETSLILALRPELVAKSEIKNFKSTQTKMKKSNEMLGYHSSAANIAWVAEDLNKQGVVGDAQKANAKNGAKMIREMVEGFIKLSNEVSKI